MADNRLSIDHSEQFADYVTAIYDNSTILYDKTKAGGSSQVGLAVSLSAADTIQLTADGDPIYGVLVSVEWDGKCTVQVGGFAQVAGGLSALLTNGLKVVGALGASSARGYVRAIAVATLADVAAGRGRIVNSTTATAVWIQL